MHGATCSPKDFILTSTAERDRNRILRRIKHCGIHLQEMFISAISDASSFSTDTQEAKKNEEEELGRVFSDIFSQLYSDLRGSPELFSKLKNEAVRKVEDIKEVLTIVVDHLNSEEMALAERRKICSTIGGAMEKLCSISELRGFVLGQIPRLVRPSGSDIPETDSMMIKHFPSWHKPYDGDGTVNKTSDDRLYKLGDALQASSGMYDLINRQFKGYEPDFYKMFDRFFQSNITGASHDASTVVDRTLLKFPCNGFAGMVYTGAKGSKVNFSMICNFLAQQSLEGRRVPVMPSLRTLPSFAFGDLGSRAGGFITDRFLSGLRPQEYFFHCMSGREGLVDTCVKTAKSGYLQRCILKSMEDVICCYDATVRSADGTIVQFAYGEDGIDVQKSAYFSRPNDIVQNAPLIRRGQKEEISSKLEKRFSALLGKDNSEENRETLYQHYKRSQCEPGEAVGCLAGQSIGEPATQMTLNTFHLAGHGATNVTLGIPRLVEILQMSGKSSTPYFSAPIVGDSDDAIGKNAQFAINALRTVPLTDVVHSVAVEEAVYIDVHGEKFYEYEVSVQYENLSAFHRAVSSISAFDILRLTAHCLLNGFLKKATGLMIVTMDSNVPFEITENTDYLNECWRRLVLQEHVQKKDKLSERIRKMALNVGGSSSAVGGTSSSKVSLYSGEGLEVIMASKENEGDPTEGEAVADQNDEPTEATEEVDSDYANNENSSDKEDSDPESEEDEDTKADSSTEAGDLSASEGEELDLGGAQELPSPKKNAQKQKDKSGVKQRSVKEKTSAKAVTFEGLTDRSPFTKDETHLYQGFETDVKVGKQNLNSVNMKVFQFAKSLRYCSDTGRMILKFGWPVKKCPYHLNLLPLLKQEISAQILRNSPGVKQARVVCSTQNGNETYNLHCDGTNLQRLFYLKENLVDFNRIQLNDVGTALRFYGVEAARACIVLELQKVFSVYGINVDYRHLSLIADFMTHKGDIRTFNRYGMARHASPLLQMSFESTMKFVVDACERGGFDNLGTPAGSIIAGRPIMLGGGLCKVLPYVDLTSKGGSSKCPSSALDYQISSSRALGVDSFVLDG